MQVSLTLFLWVMKVWISLFLIALFSLQQLPVKELGKLLAKKTCTEQSADDDTPSGDDTPGPFKQLKEKADLDKYCTTPFLFQTRELATRHRVATALHEAQRLMPHFVPEILTPPPNVA